MNGSATTEGAEVSARPRRWAVIAVATAGFAVGMAVTASLHAPVPTHAIGFWGTDKEAKAPPGAPVTGALPDFVSALP